MISHKKSILKPIKITIKSKTSIFNIYPQMPYRCMLT